MATEEYSIGYEAGYQDGLNAAVDETPARVQLTDDEIRAAYESVYIYRAVMGHGSFSFAHAVIAAYEAKNGHGG